MNYITEGPEYISITALAHEAGCTYPTLTARLRKLGISTAYRDVIDARKRLVKRTDTALLFAMYPQKETSYAH